MPSTRGRSDELKVLLDTHVWLWWVADHARLSAGASRSIDEAETIGISSISCWEVAMLVRKGRIAVDRPVDQWIRQALARPGIQAISLDPRTATEAALLDSSEFPGDPADRFIYAAARGSGSMLITRDRQLREFDSRGTIW